MSLHRVSEYFYAQAQDTRQLQTQQTSNSVLNASISVTTNNNNRILDFRLNEAFDLLSGN